MEQSLRIEQTPVPAPAARTGIQERARGPVVRLIPWVLAVLISLVARPGGAAEKAWRVDEAVGVSVNGLGVQHAIDARWSKALSNSSRPLLAGRHLALGATHSVTPAYTRFTGWVEVTPLAILDVRAGAEASTYFGTFGSLQSFQSYGDQFDDDTRRLGKSEARKGSGSRLFVSPTLKFKAGSFVAVSTADFESWKSGASGPYYYEPSRDTLLRASGDRILVVSTMALRLQGSEAAGQLGYGVRHNLTRVFDAPQNRSQRIGVFLMRQFSASRWGGRAPRIAGHVSYYLDDPNRHGQLSVGLGLSFRLTR